MSMPKTTITFDVYDAKLYPLLTDTAGGTTTYSTGIDVPGITQVSVDPEFISAELKGDARTLDRRGRTNAVNFSVGYSLLSFEVLSALFGSPITAETTSAPRSWTMKGRNNVPYFKLAFAINDVSIGVGEIHVWGLKCQMTGGNLFDQQTENYGGRSFQCQSIPTLAADEMFRVDMYPTPTALPTT